MKIEVQKAEAFELDMSKRYLITFESADELSAEDAQEIQKSILNTFSDLGVRVAAIMLNGSKLTLSEFKEEE